MVEKYVTMLDRDIDLLTHVFLAESWSQFWCSKCNESQLWLVVHVQVSLSNGRMATSFLTMVKLHQSRYFYPIVYQSSKKSFYYKDIYIQAQKGDEFYHSSHWLL